MGEKAIYQKSLANIDLGNGLIVKVDTFAIVVCSHSASEFSISHAGAQLSPLDLHLPSVRFN